MSVAASPAKGRYSMGFDHPWALDKENATDRVTVRVPAPLLDEIEQLVENGFYVNRSEVIRDGLREVVQKQAVASDDDSTDTNDDHSDRTGTSRASTSAHPHR